MINDGLGSYSRRDLIAQIEDLRYQLSTSQEQLLVSEQKIKESEVHNN